MGSPDAVVLQNADGAFIAAIENLSCCNLYAVTRPTMFTVENSVLLRLGRRVYITESGKFTTHRDRAKTHTTETDAEITVRKAYDTLMRREQRFNYKKIVMDY